MPLGCVASSKRAPCPDPETASALPCDGSPASTERRGGLHQSGITRVGASNGGILSSIEPLVAAGAVALVHGDPWAGRRIDRQDDARGEPQLVGVALAGAPASGTS